MWTFQWDVDCVILSHEVSTRQEFRCVCPAGPDHISNTIALNAVWTQTQMTDRINMPDVLLQRVDQIIKSNRYPLIFIYTHNIYECKPLIINKWLQQCTLIYLKQAPHNPIKNIPLGFSTDTNAANQEVSSPAVLWETEVTSLKQNSLKCVILLNLPATKCGSTDLFPRDVILKTDNYLHMSALFTRASVSTRVIQQHV